MVSNDSTTTLDITQHKRDFGNWLAGFVDGEGCFYLGRSKTKGGYWQLEFCFSLQLRQDDRDIIYQIRDYLGCGWIRDSTKPVYRVSKPTTGTKQAVIFRCTNINELATVLVPFFDAHPLRAKKLRDYQVWRAAILLIANVRKRLGFSKPVRGKHFYKHWSAEDLQTYFDLVDALRDLRKFKAAA